METESDSPRTPPGVDESQSETDDTIFFEAEGLGQNRHGTCRLQLQFLFMVDSHSKASADVLQQRQEQKRLITEIKSVISSRMVHFPSEKQDTDIDPHTCGGERNVEAAAAFAEAASGLQDARGTHRCAYSPFPQTQCIHNFRIFQFFPKVWG